MEKRKLGKSGLEISAMGLGCMGLTFGYGPATSEADAIALIRKAYDLGITFFNTAEAYSQGLNEQFLGKAVKPFREENVGAVNVALSEGDLQKIHHALEEIKIVGDRYPAALQARVGK